MTVVGSAAGWQEGLTACERTVVGVEEVCTVGKAKRLSIESLDRWTSLDVSTALESEDPDSVVPAEHSTLEITSALVAGGAESWSALTEKA